MPIIPKTVSYSFPKIYPEFSSWIKVVTAATAGAAVISLNPSVADSAQVMPPAEITGNEKDVDLWRETNLRYMGYANEVGESVGVVYPKYIFPSYVVAFGYVGGDTVDKAWKSYQSGDPGIEIVKKGGDALVWQTLASVIIPGKLINVVANGINGTTGTAETLPASVRKWGATVCGLLTIPFIVHPIDHLVDVLLDNTLRTLY